MLVEGLPHGSRLVRAVNPAAVWGAEENLLAGIFDVLQLANWQRTGKGARPKPLPRPGREAGRRMGTARPLSETRDLFDRWRSGRLHAQERGGSHVHTRKGEVRHGRN